MKFIIFLIIIILNPLTLFSKEKDKVYLQCNTKSGPVMGYILLPKQNLVMVPHPTEKFDFANLKTTPARYEFEYKTALVNIEISINRMSGALTEIWSSEDLKNKTVFRGKCVKKDLDKPKF
jgi:hypothetical protein